MTTNTLTPCSWCLGSELYRDYHDAEWGVPCRDESELLEMLCLEGAQAGLSWITILNKRENYRRLYRQFDPAAMASLVDEDLERFVLDPGIVRHRQKIWAFRANALAVLALHEQGEFLSEFVWSHVDDKPVINHWSNLSEIPSSTETSTRMSKALKKRGFSFVGPTTCYAFMQAAGLVNDHMTSCSRHAELSG